MVETRLYPRLVRRRTSRLRLICERDFAGQHAPYRLANGNILIFDNGPHRLDRTFPFSRVIEVNSATNEIVWTYQEPREFNFFSPRISNAQRLPNGNTLINEGASVAFSR